MIGDRFDHRDDDVRDARDGNADPPVEIEELEVVHAGGKVVFDGEDDGERVESTCFEYLENLR